MVETKRTARAEATRAHLVGAAAEVFATRGYREATVSAITEAAGTAHGTFYMYFKNRDDAFVQVISDVLDELYRHSFTPLEDLPGQRDPRVLRDRIAGFLEVCARHGGLWRALLEGALASPVVEQAWMAERRRMHEALFERQRHFGEDQEARGVDPQVVAYALASMIEWYALSEAVFSPSRTVAVTDTAIDSLTAVWLRAVGADA
jgi:AcrR family transcriptional regulator